ncbi:hypothetical protein BN946_scf184965.g5 [Trametes cinnabarina]|uniref:AB hydrolase-1 domain-containing protein n=1 Tax=Pycnoporus cinnabarinus TaxID=5643 RepID=A0A060SRC5_PYCCI|nr:hypothetical protein BN946_scf184965.g5 [Trametes cinnabarina]
MSSRLASSVTAAMTTVMKGSNFEERSLGVLREHLSMSLRRVGGKGDGGIDLQGWWWLPVECLSLALSSSSILDSCGAMRRRIRVIAQCKAEEKKIGPRYIRELEGTVLRHSTNPMRMQTNLPPQSGDPTWDALVGMFISISPFTKASLLLAYSSPIPLALLHLPEEFSNHTPQAVDSAEYARDLTNFLLYYLPRSAAYDPLVNLPRLPEGEALLRMRKGVKGRTIVGVGHSVGACSLVYPTIEYPVPFSSLIFVESFTIPEFVKHLDAHRKNEALCLRRRCIWNSLSVAYSQSVSTKTYIQGPSYVNREEATRDLKRNPYYREWHPRALDAFIQHALMRTSDGRIRTKTHPVPEATMLIERRVVYETPDALAFDMFRFLLSNYLERACKL